MDAPDLLPAALDIERHVATQGWDQPSLLFALVPTDHVRRAQPELAAQMGINDGGPALTTFEQPRPPDEEALDAFLARIEWPAEISGAALVVERIVLPPEAEAALADRPDTTTAAREHPRAQDVRIVAAVTRDGQRMSVLRLRGDAGKGSDMDAAEDSVLTGPDLVPGLTDALLATFS